MEMTGSFHHLLSLMLVSMTAFLVAEYMGSEPVYDMLLNRSLALMDRARQHIHDSREKLSEK
jgi:H+/Cl- antiporter ClcA